MSGVIRTVPCGCESGQPCTPATRCAITTAVHIQREDDEAEMERLREDHEAELAALRAEKERAEKSLLDKEWCIERIASDLKNAGIDLQWTDGGGSEAPSGWHRNPYINVGSFESNQKHINALQSKVEALLRDQDSLTAELAALRAQFDAAEKARCHAVMLNGDYTEELAALRVEHERLKGDYSEEAVHLRTRAVRAEAELSALRAEAPTAWVYEQACKALHERAERAEVDAEIGRKWHADSSLETWFPYTAEELTRLRAELAALRADAAEAWRQVHLLKAETSGPDGFATWKDASTDERVRRVKAEAEAARLRAAGRALLACPHIAERDTDPDWVDAETEAAVAEMRDALGEAK